MLTEVLGWREEGAVGEGGVAPVRLMLASLWDIVQQGQPHAYPLAVDIVNQVYEAAHHLIPIKLYARLVMALKILVSPTLLSTVRCLCLVTGKHR